MGVKVVKSLREGDEEIRDNTFWRFVEEDEEVREANGERSHLFFKGYKHFED